MSTVIRDISTNWGRSGVTLGYRVLDGDDNALIARTTSGVVESPAGSGQYHAKIATWSSSWIGRVVWDDGTGSPRGTASESFDAIVVLTAAIDPRGPGANQVTIQVSNSTTGQPVADADVWITIDSAGSSTIAGTLQTNSGGSVTFLLDAGQTYYLWLQEDGVNSIRGQSFVAQAD